VNRARGPPYIAEVGLSGRATLEHNFETLYWVRDSVEKSAHWFNSLGGPGWPGAAQFQRQWPRQNAAHLNQIALDFDMLRPYGCFIPMMPIRLFVSRIFTHLSTETGCTYLTG